MSYYIQIQKTMYLQVSAYTLYFKNSVQQFFLEQIETVYQFLEKLGLKKVSFFQLTFKGM